MLTESTFGLTLGPTGTVSFGIGPVDFSANLGLTANTVASSQTGHTSYVSWTIKNQQNQNQDSYLCPRQGSTLAALQQVTQSWTPGQPLVSSGSEAPTLGNWIARATQ